MKKLIIPILVMFLLVGFVSALNPNSQTDTGFSINSEFTEVDINFYLFNPGNVQMPIQSNLNPQLSLEELSDGSYKFGLILDLPNPNFKIDLVFISDQLITYPDFTNWGLHDYFYLGDIKLNYQDLIRAGYTIEEVEITDYTLTLRISGMGSGVVNLDPSLAPGQLSTLYHGYFYVDPVAPTVNLISPLDNSTLQEGSITFNYNVSDFTPIDNCTLNFGGVEFLNESTITKDTTLSFTKSKDSGTYNVYVKCSDKVGNIGTSNSITLFLSQLSQSGSGGTGTPYVAPSTAELDKINATISSIWNKGITKEIDLYFYDKNDLFINPSSIVFSFSPNPENFETISTTQISTGHYKAKFKAKEVGDYTIEIKGTKEKIVTLQEEFTVEDPSLIDLIVEEAEKIIEKANEITGNVLANVEDSNFWKQWMDLKLEYRIFAILFLFFIIAFIIFILYSIFQKR